MKQNKQFLKIFSILTLSVFTVFAFINCKNDSTEPPDTTPPPEGTYWDGTNTATVTYNSDGSTQIKGTAYYYYYSNKTDSEAAYGKVNTNFDMRVGSWENGLSIDVTGVPAFDTLVANAIWGIGIIGNYDGDSTNLKISFHSDNNTPYSFYGYLSNQ